MLLRLELSLNFFLLIAITISKCWCLLSEAAISGVLFNFFFFMKENLKVNFKGSVYMFKTEV